MQRKYAKDRLIDERYTDLERVDFDPARMPDTEPTPSPRPATQPHSAARRETFVRLPVAWIDRLHGARGATWDVATHLLLRSFKEHRQTIRLANTALASIGVAPKQKWRRARGAGKMRAGRHLTATLAGRQMSRCVLPKGGREMRPRCDRISGPK